MFPFYLLPVQGWSPKLEVKKAKKGKKKKKKSKKLSRPSQELNTSTDQLQTYENTNAFSGPNAQPDRPHAYVGVKEREKLVACMVRVSGLVLPLEMDGAGRAR